MILDHRDVRQEEKDTWRRGGVLLLLLVRIKTEEALVSALRRMILLAALGIDNAQLENPTQLFLMSLDAIQVKVMRILLVCIVHYMKRG
jgi:hypothetical protein